MVSRTIINIEKNEPREKENSSGEKNRKIEHKDTIKEKAIINDCKSLNGIHQSPTDRSRGSITKIVKTYITNILNNTKTYK
jgi:hypothetical protein